MYPVLCEVKANPTTKSDLSRSKSGTSPLYMGQWFPVHLNNRYGTVVSSTSQNLFLERGERELHLSKMPCKKIVGEHTLVDDGYDTLMIMSGVSQSS
jgi:hypothetical protein